MVLFTDYPTEMPKLPPPMISSESKHVIDESEDTLKSGVETSVEMDNSTDVEMAE